MWNPFKRTPIMEFYCHPANHGVFPEPKPAAKAIPEWFKKVPLRMEDRDAHGAKTMTVKQCMPVLDAMSLGYVIPLCGDLSIKTNEDLTRIEVTSSPAYSLAEFHDIRQLGEKTAPGFPAQPIKFINPWVIKTAPGWSTWILPLTNHFNTHFTCLSGLVDTDKYPKEINFPAVWHTPNFDDTLPAGTPLVVAVPIKRSAVPTKPIVRKMSDEEYNKIDLIKRQQDNRRKVYTSELREPRK